MADRAGSDIVGQGSNKGVAEQSMAGIDETEQTVAGQGVAEQGREMARERDEGAEGCMRRKRGTGGWGS